jgi:hypothetical protein
MNAGELADIGDHLLKHTPIEFLGVFPRDHLPKEKEIPRYPACLIVNTDTSDGPGIHWVAIIHLSRSASEFFDSLAFPPSVYDISVPKLQKQSLYAIQSPISKACGQHCLFYLNSRAHGEPLTCFYSHFSRSQLDSNDSIVMSFVKRARKLCPKCEHSVKCYCNRMCACNV